MRPSLLIAEGQRMFAEGLCSLLCSSYEVVGIASNGSDLAELALRHKPDLIVTDVSMPPPNGLDCVQTLREAGLNSKFVVLTMHLDVDHVVQLFRAGASAIVLKMSSRDELMLALKVAHRDGHYLSPQFRCDLVTVLTEAARQPAVDCGPRITRRQREMLLMVAEGKTMKQIAAHLNISTRTAESRKYHLMDVLAVRTNAELVQYAVKIGLISVNPIDTLG